MIQLGDREVDGDDLDAGDDREEHRDLHVDLELADVVTVVVVASGQESVRSWCEMGRLR
jgi:hypothetical protein